MLMSAAEKRTDTLSSESRPKLPTLKPVVLVAVVALALSMAASVWMYLRGTRELRIQARAHGVDLYLDGTNALPIPVGNGEPASPGLLKQMDGWAMRVTIAT